LARGGGEDRAMKSPELPVSSAPPEPGIRERLWRIVFLSDTPAGRWFDIVLLWLVSVSVLVVMLESVESMRRVHGPKLRAAEWVFTIIFTLEYLVRVAVVRRPSRYIFSFYGIIDLLAVVPSYLELLLAGTHYLMTLRILRLLRMFRVFKMARHMGEAGVLINALRASRAKIIVFLFSVGALVSVEGTLMYLFEHRFNEGFNSIPHSIYWAIVTLTTVGYGDVVPVTVLGKMMASVVMLTGFAIIAVPTGVVTAELGREMAIVRDNGRRCGECGWQRHDSRARFCQQCGTRLE
jgi:voltage-gated potassium channel